MTKRPWADREQTIIFGAVRSRPGTRHLIGFFLVLLAGPLAGQQPGTVPPGPAVSTYHLRPGDFVRVAVWGQEAYSGLYQIDERGILEYPGVGEIEARELTVADLRDRIRKGLQNIFNSPFVVVRPEFRMAVIGQVERPNLYTVDPTMSVLDVVALAGGPTPSGNLKGLRLLSAGGERRPGAEARGVRGRTLQEIGVQSGDQIVIPRKFFSREDLILVLQIVQIAVSVAVLSQTIK